MKYVKTSLIIMMLINVSVLCMACTSSKEETVKQSIEIPSRLVAVDLGLPSGTLWANMNLGATSPEEFGDYFAWGETTPKRSDTGKWNNYQHVNGTTESCRDIGNDISGTNYDAAHVKWQRKWQIPTAEQFLELMLLCEYELTSRNGIKGYLFTSNINSKSIFIPLAHEAGGVIGAFGCYWSSTIFEDDNGRADVFFMDEFNEVDVKSSSRCSALSIRPVCRP